MVSVVLAEGRENVLECADAYVFRAFRSWYGHMVDRSQTIGSHLTQKDQHVFPCSSDQLPIPRIWNPGSQLRNTGQEKRKKGAGLPPCHSSSYH